MTAADLRTLFTVPPERVDPDERFTPRWLFDALGEIFDLDPASPVEGGDMVPALCKFTRYDDGLEQPWHGFVWCNPPFSNATAFANRFIAHGCGLWLGPVAAGAWFQRMARAADRLWLMRDFAFNHPTHAGKRSSMPLGLAAIDDRAVNALDRAAAALPDAGVLVTRVRSGDHTMAASSAPPGGNDRPPSEPGNEPTGDRSASEGR